jgi:F0F1-type ATP synthase assembly protein I
MARLSTLAGGGLEFAGAILVGLFGGQWLDRRLGTGPWLVVVGVFVGAAAGFVSLYRALTGGRPSRSSSRGAGPGTGG